MWKRGVVWSVLAGVAIATSACGSSDSSSSTTAAGTASQAQASTAAATAGDGQAAYSDATKAAQIEFIANVVNPFTASNGQGARDAAKKYGLEHVDFVQSNGDPSKDIELINGALTKGAKAIIIHPNSSEADAPILNAAAKKGVCLILNYGNLGSTPPSEVAPGAKAFLGWDDAQTGKNLARVLAEKMGGKGGVVIMTGVPADTADKARVQAAKAEWKANYPGIKVLAIQPTLFDPSKARSLMQNWLQQYGDQIGGVMTMADTLSTAAADVIDQSSLKGKVAIGGYGAQKQGLEYIKQGKVTATVPFAPRDEGEAAVKIAADCVEGDRTPVLVSPGDLDVMKPFASTNYIITDENADKFTPQW